MVALNFNAANFNPEPEYAPWPEGWYPVIIEASESKQNNDKETGGHLLLKLRCIDGPKKGAVQDLRLGIWHTKSEDAVRIGNQQLSAISWVTGTIQVPDSAALHNKPFQVYSTPQEREVKNPQTGVVTKRVNNNITDFRDIHGRTATECAKGLPPAAAPGPTPAAPPAYQQQAQPPAAPPPATAPYTPQQPPASVPPATAQPWAPPGAGPVVSPSSAPPAQPGGYVIETGVPQPPAAPAAGPQPWTPPGGAAPGGQPWGR